MNDPAFARLVCQAIAMLVRHWDAAGLPPAHPYRQVAAMFRSYFQRIQRGETRERTGEL